MRLLTGQHGNAGWRLRGGKTKFIFERSGFQYRPPTSGSGEINFVRSAMMSQTTYEAALRLLELIGNDRGPVLSRAAAEFRACILSEQVRLETKAPAENLYFQSLAENAT